MLETSNRPAFYLTPGARNQDGIPVQNITILSNYRFSKKVKIGVPNIQHAIEFRTGIEIPLNESPSKAAFENVTAYIGPEFNRFFTYNPAVGLEVESPSDNPATKDFDEKHIAGNNKLPVIAATSDLRYALAIYTPRSQRHSVSYLHIEDLAEFGDGGRGTNPVTKLNSVFRINSNLPTAGHPTNKTFHFVSYLVVGNMQNVKTTLDQLYASGY